MSSPGSSATIRFPASLIDRDIRKELEDYGVKFKEDDPREQEHELEVIENTMGDPEAEIEEGIFRLHHSDVAYGEFEDLETMLQEKDIPFDRQSNMDWNRAPVLRVFRPAGSWDNEMDLYLLLDPETDEPVVSVNKIRELLAIDDAGEEAASNIRRYLDDNFPDYPPLSAWVEEAGSHG